MRAIALLVVVMANLIYAIPYPRLAEADLTDPEWHRGDMERWAQVLTSVGLAVDTDTVQTYARSAAVRFQGAIEGLRAPFAFYFASTSTNQQWGLFGRVTEQPDTFVIEVQREGEWEPYYRRLDPDYDWRDGMLKYRRARGVWDGVRDEPKGTYKRFTVWLAREIFAEHADVNRVRVYLERQRIAKPRSHETFEPEMRAERSHRRENHAPPSEAR